MPYKDNEQQKEYQRLWAKNLKNKMRIRNGHSDVLHGRPIFHKRDDGTVDLKSRKVTWAELTQEKIESISDFDECVKKAKRFIFGAQTDRILIASLALRACEIRRGGDNRSEESKETKNKKTLVEFARKININHKTLGTWIAVKTKIVDKLPKSIKEISWTAANSALKNETNGQFKNTEEAYNHFCTPDPFKRNAEMVTKYLILSARRLTAIGLKGFEEEQIKKCQIALKASNSVFKK